MDGQNQDKISALFLDFQKRAAETSYFLIIAIFEGKIIMIKIFLS